MTAQDVQSSLYYVHVDSEDDERLYNPSEPRLAQDPKSSSSQEESSFEGLSSIASDEVSRDTPAVAPPDPSPRFLRKPINQGAQPVVQAAQSRPNPPGVQLMGPRAMHPRLGSVDNPGLKVAHGKENLVPRRRSEQPQTAQLGHVAASPHRPISAIDGLSGSRILAQETTHERLLHERRRSSQSQKNGLSLTLIRRYDGLQWNVGKICNAHEENDSQNNPLDRLNSIAIEISTPGYAIFNPSSLSKASEAPNYKFERRLMKPRRRSHGSDPVEDSRSGTKSQTPRKRIDFRRLSKPHLGGDRGENSNRKRSPEGSSSNIQGYGFQSPWSGTCEFSPSVTGHALKCKHTASEQNSQAVTVSELRFNLPTSNVHGTASPNILHSPEKPGYPTRGSYFSRKRSSEATSAETSDPKQIKNMDDDDYFDLSLGQEKSGGGFGGKQAKLGKLIIEPEGLKMLDLLVAANMSLWWKAYERST